MTQKYLVVLVTLGFLCLSGGLWAEGSFSFDDELQPILNSIPEIKSYVLNHYSFASSGWANRIGNNVNPRFGGRRLGPYTISATAKDTSFNGAYEISFIPVVQYRDQRGRPTTLENAYMIKEILQSVDIKATPPQTAVSSYQYLLYSFNPDSPITINETIVFTGTDRLSGQHHFRITCFGNFTSLSLFAHKGSYHVIDSYRLLTSQEFLSAITHVEIVHPHPSYVRNKSR